MKSYAIRLRPLGPWSTPWHADSIFAALCWQLRWSRGEERLTELLARFRSGDAPFVLSDAFPEGWLPRPLGAPEVPLAHSNLMRKPPDWIPEATFRGLLRGDGSLPQPAERREPLESSRRLHAAISRRSGTTAEGGSLYEVAEWRVRTEDGQGGNGNLALYARCADRPDLLLSLLGLLGESGFGKKRTSGHGAFRVEGGAEPCAWLDDVTGADGFVSLSHFIPAAGDPTDGFWRLATKYPKFAAEAPVSSPFKGRLSLLRPGSMFRTGSAPRPFYGRILFDFSREFPAAAHYGLAFAAPLRWPGRMAE